MGENHRRGQNRPDRRRPSELSRQRAAHARSRRLRGGRRGGGRHLRDRRRRANCNPTSCCSISGCPTSTASRSPSDWPRTARRPRSCSPRAVTDRTSATRSIASPARRLHPQERAERGGHHLADQMTSSAPHADRTRDRRPPARGRRAGGGHQRPARRPSRRLCGADARDRLGIHRHRALYLDTTSREQHGPADDRGRFRRPLEGARPSPTTASSSRSARSARLLIYALLDPSAAVVSVRTAGARLDRAPGGGRLLQHDGGASRPRSYSSTREQGAARAAPPIRC